MALVLALLTAITSVPVTNHYQVQAKSQKIQVQIKDITHDSQETQEVSPAEPTVGIQPELSKASVIEEGKIYGRTEISLPILLENTPEDAVQEIHLSDSTYFWEDLDTYPLTSYQWQDNTATWQSMQTETENDAVPVPAMVQETYQLAVTREKETLASQELTLVWDKQAPVLTLTDSEETLAKLRELGSERVTLHYKAWDTNFTLEEGREIKGSGMAKICAEFVSSRKDEQTIDTIETTSLEEITLDFQNITSFHGVCRIYGVDKVGNQSKITELPVQVDSIAPKIQIIEKQDSPWKDQVVITAKVWEEDFGEDLSKAFWYEVEGTNVPRYDGITYSKNEQESSQYMQVYDVTLEIPRETYENFQGNCHLYARDKRGNKTATGENNRFSLSFDSAAPQVEGITITDDKKNPLESICNQLSFGMFFRDKIKIQVKVSDKKINNACSGIKSLILTVDGENYPAAVKTGIGTGQAQAEFYLDKQKKYETLLVTVTDNAGNVTEQTIGELDSTLDTPGIYLDQEAPKISVLLVSEGVRHYKAEDKKNWYASDVTFQVVVRDSLSGIEKIQATINGKNITKDILGKTISDKDMRKQLMTRKEFMLSTSQGKEDEKVPGKYQITIQVTDNSGNVTTRTKNVYIDRTAPYISKVQVSGRGSLAGKGKLTTENTYGYYIKGAATLRITAGDRKASAGLKSISYYTLEYQSNKKGIESREQTIPVDNKGQAELVLPKNFKGIVYLKATDNVDNTTNSYKHTHAIISTNEKVHKASSSITCTLPDTQRKDSQGLLLYEKDVPVKVKIKDKDTGIQSLTYQISSPHDSSQNQKKTITVNEAGELSDTSGVRIKKTERNIVTEIEGELLISNDSNQIELTLLFTDRAGMSCEKKLLFSIDKQKPQIEVTYDKDSTQTDSAGNTYYNEDRTATIVVQERNFDPAKMVVEIQNSEGGRPELSSWEKSENSQNPDKTTYTARAVFASDGVYTLKADCEDMAGNTAQTYQGESFVLDKTKPVVAISWNQDKAGGYYNQPRQATLTITEHNFDSSKLKLTENGSQKIPAISSFQSQGDTHQATLTFAEDGEYKFTADYEDKAGNQAESCQSESFVIDTTEPELSFEGIQEQGAYREDIAPKLVCRDENIDLSTLQTEITQLNQDSRITEDTIKLEPQQTAQNTYQAALPNPEHSRDKDGIYQITAKVQDRAGNEKEESITFSINRFGSVYEFGQEAERVSGTYVCSIEDIAISEINADEIPDEDVKVKLTRNGETKELVKGQDYERRLQSSEGSWKQYEYTIAEENFAEDGVYILSIATKDKAGNYNENTKENTELWFGVDKTAPVILPLNLQENQSYNQTELEAQIEVQDNLKLSQVQVYVNGELTEVTEQEEQYHFRLAESPKAQTIRICALDAAGNQQERELTGIYITTNPWVRLIHNTKAVAAVGAVAGLCIVAAVITMVVRRKKKHGTDQ